MARRLRKASSAPSVVFLKEMREKESKDERGTREVWEFFRSASPRFVFCKFSQFILKVLLILNYKIPMSAPVNIINMFCEHEGRLSFLIFYRIIRYPTELFGPPNYFHPLPKLPQKNFRSKFIGEKVLEHFENFDFRYFLNYGGRRHSVQKLVPGTKSCTGYKKFVPGTKILKIKF